MIANIKWWTASYLGNIFSMLLFLPSPLPSTLLCWLLHVKICAYVRRLQNSRIELCVISLLMLMVNNSIDWFAFYLYIFVAIASRGCYCPMQIRSIQGVAPTKNCTPLAAIITRIWITVSIFKKLCVNSHRHKCNTCTQCITKSAPGRLLCLKGVK